MRSLPLGTTTICGVIDGGDWLTATDENSNPANAKKARIFIAFYNIPSGAAGFVRGSLPLFCPAQKVYPADHQNPKFWANGFIGCGDRGEALFDQRLIPLGFAGSVAAGRGQEIAKVGSKRVIEI